MESKFQPKVYLARIYRYSSAHRLYSKALTERENLDVYGKCCNLNGHGHNYVLEVTVAGPRDPATGTVMSVGKLDGIVAEKIIEPWDHRNLDEEIPDFKEVMSTGENIARIVWEKLEPALPPGLLFSVRLSETSRSFFEYYGGGSQQDAPASRRNAGRQDVEQCRGGSQQDARDASNAPRAGLKEVPA